MAHSSCRVVLVLIGTVAGAATQAQSQGAQMFQAFCERCHANAEMNGRLNANWLGKSAADLYQRIKTTMPAESPGSRSDEEYLAVTAYVLQTFDVEVPQKLASLADFDKVSIKPAARE